MKGDLKALEQLLADRQEQSKSRHSYVAELKAMTAKLGTDKQEFETDLIETENDAKYYDDEVTRLKHELARASKSIGGKVGRVLPQTPRQGVGSLIISSVSFVAGALLGSRLKSRKDKQDRNSCLFFPQGTDSNVLSCFSN